MNNKGERNDIGELYVFAQEIIQQIGREALTFFSKERHQKPAFDQDLVTQAELHLSQAFHDGIADHYPKHQAFGQGTLDEGYTHSAGRYLWVFDALDGVDNFQSGIPIWGMSIALYENYWPVLGLFYMPATNDLFRACVGQDAYWNDRRIKMGNRGEISQESLLLTFSRFHLFYKSQFPGKIRDFGSTGAHVCYVAMGRADAACVANESFKDLCAVSVIIEAAGGKLFKGDGGAFFLGDYLDGTRIDDRLIIASPSNAQIILDSLIPIQS